MNRLVVIHSDKLKVGPLTIRNEGFEVVLGGERIRRRLQQTVEKHMQGYQLVFDAQLPSRQVAQLDIGVPASFTFVIDSTKSLEKQIDEDSLRLLTVLFDVVPRVRDTVEQVVSATAAASIGSLSGSIDRKLRLAYVFPELAEKLRLDLNQVQALVPYIRIDMSGTINVSRAVDASLDESQRRKLDILQALMTQQLTTAYHPEDEGEARHQYYVKLMQDWPSINAPTEQELSALRAMVRSQPLSLSQALLPGPYGVSGFQSTTLSLKRR